MAFSEEVKDLAFKNAGGRCERCGMLCHRVRTDYGYAYPGFEFHHRTSVQAGGSDGISNCEFLCSTCHENTSSYGRH